MKGNKKIFCFLLAFALLLRLAGIVGDKHAVYDENFSPSVKALSGEIIPEVHYYPAFYNYLIAFSYAIMYGTGKFLGFWTTTQSFQNQWFNNPLPFYFAGRFVTAILGALSSPLAFLITLYLGCEKKVAIFAGVILAILPVNILLSHYSKSDVALGTSIFFLIFIFVKYYPYLPVFLIGIAVALCISFKHSAIFFLFPFTFLIFIDQIYSKKKSVPCATITFLKILLVASITVLILNIGTFLDFRNFIEYQALQKRFSLHQSSFRTLVEYFIPFLGSNQQGASWLGLGLWAIVPVFRRNSIVLIIWLSTLIACIIIGMAVGDRILNNHVLPYTMLIVLMAVISLNEFITSKIKVIKVTGYIAAFALFMLLSYFSINVIRQALAPSLTEKVSEFIQSIANEDKDKIVVSSLNLINLPIKGEAYLDENKRDLQLSEKYDILLPQKSPQRLAIYKNLLNGFYVRRLPFAFGGLEGYSSNEKIPIKPFAWPIQDQEWDIAFWKNNHFTYFILENEDRIINSKPIQYAQLYEQIKKEGTLLTTFKSSRPLFLEGDVSIYKLPPQ